MLEPNEVSFFTDGKLHSHVYQLEGLGWVLHINGDEYSYTSPRITIHFDTLQKVIEFGDSIIDACTISKESEDV